MWPSLTAATATCTEARNSRASTLHGWGCRPANRVDMCCQRPMRCCLGISLLFNHALALIGVGACGYGVRLESQANYYPLLGGVACWPLFPCYVCGGHRSTCYGYWYIALMTGFAINAASCMCFFTKKEVVT